MPSTHIETVSSSPGITGFEKRPSIERKRFGVAAAQRVQQRAAGEAVGAEPVQDRALEAAELREGGIGVERVAVAREPVEQRLVDARRVASARGRACAPGQLEATAGPRSPPKPPSPRKNAVMRVRNRGFPVATFTESETRSTEAAFPLSQIAAMVPVLSISPSGGISPNSSMP